MGVVPFAIAELVHKCPESATTLKCEPLSVTVGESVPGTKSCDQPIWLKLGTEVGCDEIFQKPLKLTSVTLSLEFQGRGVSFFAL